MAPRSAHGTPRTVTGSGDANDCRGFALLLSLLVLVMVSALATGLIVSTQTGTLTAYNYKTSAQAQYLAEAGVQAAIGWFDQVYQPTVAPVDASTAPVQWNGAAVGLSAITGESSNFPESTTSGSFEAQLGDRTLGVDEVPGSFSVAATLQSKDDFEEIWEIRSQGRIEGFADGLAEAKAVVRVRSSAFPYAVVATDAVCKAIDFGSSSATDSWDSSQGTYDQTWSNTGGDVATNGSVDMSGSSAIWGNAHVPDPSANDCADGFGVKSSSSYGVMGATLPGGALNMPAPPAVVAGGADLTFDGSGGSLAPGTYGDLEVSGGGVLELAPGEYTFNSIKATGGATITIAPAGPVTIHVAGDNVTKAIDMSGGTFSNPSGIPLDMRIYYGGSLEVVLSGGSGAYGVLYAPGAPTKMTGGGDWYGAMVISTLTNTGGSKVHYDKALAGSGAGKVSALSFSQQSR